jgi:hypothetical protein
MPEPASTDGYLLNTAGEWERDRKSRAFNGTEAFLVMTFILVALWPLSYVVGKIYGVEFASTLGTWMLTAGAIYLLFIAPRIHGDTLNSWGLGNPRTLFRLLRDLPPLKRGLLATTVVAIFVALNYLNYVMWPEVADFFNLDETPAMEWNTHFPGVLMVVAFGVVLSSLILLYGIRYDNFWSAFKIAMMVALPLFFIVCLGAFAQRGWAAFSGFEPATFFLGVFGYLFWGFVQQLILSAYFRKAFGPSTHPNNSKPPAQRPVYAALFAVACALLAGPAILFGVRYVYGADALPLSSMVWFAAFAAPVGGIYGYFYARNRKRVLVATLTASCFGLIHLVSYGLVTATWILGIILVYVFMEDRYRNLVALGFIHGLLGTTLGWLFSKGESGVMEINYSVGPEAIKEVTWGAAGFPLICLAIYVGLAIWCASRLKELPRPLAASQ